MASNFKWIGLSEDGNSVVLHKFTGEFSAPTYATDEWLEAHRDEIRVGVALDVETTGLDSNGDDVIEVAARSFQFNRDSGAILRFGKEYSGLQDPGRPLSDDVKQLTGLNDEMLKGKTIDWQKLEELVRKTDIVIAHNAGFDRPFIDKNLQGSKEKFWGCSFKQIDWWAKGFTSAKLEILSIYHGFFVDAHRAMNDVNALIKLVNMVDGETGQTYLKELIQNARRTLVRVDANGSPYESKDVLKSRKYRWDSGKRHWYKHIYKEDVDTEVQWLKESVYGGRFGGNLKEIPLTDNFKQGC